MREVEPVAIPVDQDRPDMGSLKTIIRKLKEGERVVVGEASAGGASGGSRRPPGMF